MFLNKIRLLWLLPFLIEIVGCGSVPLPPVLSPHEQLKVDTVKVKGLLTQFEKQVQVEKDTNIEKYLTAVARQITREEIGLREEKVLVRVLLDTKPELKKSFSFPGVVIFIPKSILHLINFENELAALIALELAQIERRDLAQEMDKNESPILFGDLSIFHFSQKSRSEAIELGTKLMYAAGYDPRGMVALFQKFPKYFLDPTTPAGQKELNEYLKHAQKAKNEFMPSLQPIVRSNDFLRMKKELK
jgi:predicted Zn-dependent protease